MAAFVLTSKYTAFATGWTGTAPGAPGTQTISGTLTTAVDFSGAVQQAVDIGYNSDMIDVTSMTSGGFRQFIAGLTSGDDIQLPLIADFAASAAWADVQTIFGTLGISRPGDSEVYMEMKPTSASRGSTNPSFVCAVLSKGVQMLNGGVGDLATHALTLQITGAFGILTS